MRTVMLVGSKAAGRVALVDDQDYELVSQYRWRLHERRYPNGRTEGPYARTTLQRGGKRADPFMHTLITGYPHIDHINHDGLDNQRVNLRPATKAQNNHNQRPQAGHSSRFKGVTWHSQAHKWQAAIKIGGKCRHLGLFGSEQGAADAYDQAAEAEYGEYAYLNRVGAA